MAESFDTIVIGAGIGGLTAAAYLIKAGLRVLVLEGNAHPGGTAYVYHRKGFTFPMGPLGFSHPELIHGTLKDLDIGKNLQLSRVHYRLRAFDLDVPLSQPFPEMIIELSRFFHSDAEGIQLFFKNVEDMACSKDPLYQEIPDISALEYLRHHIRDWRLRRILGSMGTREPYSGLPLLAAMWNLMCRKGIWYPKEGMKSFCDRLVKAVTNLQGIHQIQLGKEVLKIRVEKERVIGVTLQDGTKIHSSSVISNADYKSTFMRLLNSEEIPLEWYQTVSNARQTGSIFQVCLGIDKNRVDLSAFEKAGRLIYRGDKERVEDKIDWDVAKLAPNLIAKQELEVSLWGREGNTLSPEGGIVIVIRTEAEYSHFARYRSGLRRRVPEYRAYKDSLAHALIHEIDDLIPGIEDAILVIDVSTPLTFEDQGGRSQGAVAGWSWDYDDSQDNHPKELIRTPIKGLYMAGYQAFSTLLMGGIPTAIESGKRAASLVLEGVGPIEKILIPGVRRREG
jgi:phytoene dehydrogenase-like protein